MDFLLYMHLHIFSYIVFAVPELLSLHLKCRFDTHLFRKMTVETLGISFLVVQYISNFLEWLEDNLFQVM